MSNRGLCFSDRGDILFMKIVSWNVNGLVACKRKGFLRFLSDTRPDIMCCQEIKTQCPLNTPGYQQFWNKAKQPGYSGTLVLAKQTPLSWSTGFGIEKFDIEGRVITLEYHDFYVVNVYVPSIHPHNSAPRPDYRLEWDAALRDYVKSLHKPVVLCGDFNATLAWIDSYPANGKNEPDNPFFVSETRAGLQQLLSIGLVDAFRALHPNREGAYTWWGPKNHNRAENRGSRLDYFLVSGELLSFVQGVKFHKDILGSDHCPLSMLFSPARTKQEIYDDDLADVWQTIDWGRMEETLLSMQQDISYAAYNREWDEVDALQHRLVNSWAARAMAVKETLNTSTTPGVDGVRWSTDTQKAKAIFSLKPRGYRPLPYLHRILEERGKQRNNLIPAMRDKAMQMLYSFSLDPVAEATADRKSFFSRRGRSALDAHAYLTRDLSGDNAPDYVVLVDVQTFYDTVIHDWLIQNTPMDKTMLRKFLKAGMLHDGEFLSTDKGMSMASSLSPILGNIMLDGLQSFIYDRLYPKGKVDYLDGNLNRFADDMCVTARSRESAEHIMQIIADFLELRGLRMHPDKSFIADVRKGFNYLGRHYQRRGHILTTTPSDTSMKRMEQELENFILSFVGSQRDLIEKINQKLTGWGNYHRVEDAYMEFRHIDAVVESLLIKKMCAKYPRWHRQTVLEKFWIKDGDNYIFVLPTDKTVRVNRLAPLPIARHKPCKLSFNPYLDNDYHIYLKHRRDTQKSNGRYRAVWTRQSGRCAYCGERMLADQDVELVERNLGQGWSIRNLIYIHRQCAETVSYSNEDTGAHIDLFALLDGVMDDAPAEESLYKELTEFFRLNRDQTINIHFKQIEAIIGDSLPWEAYCFDSFWYDDTEDMTSPMWREEEFPFQIFRFSVPGYSISDTWTSQGYAIKKLHRESNRVVFRKIAKNTSGIMLPEALTERQLPDEITYKFDKMVRQFVRDNGL